ncbi:hypothetical protein NM688_g6334 [Phlebia brevispora]|uniref:Uncharacterized protein n=1 Tax=Phlebia brevispora TaxID=194682 RepID=A0ACC1SHC7_9APHY|nr:hypothetical protein NM688_g6334 [Phlebia brevispora]
MVTDIPVKKGQTIWVSVCTYNRLTDVWGADAHEWNPMRFVNDDSEKQVKIGMYSNLMSFSAGLRGCIGWRFSVIEMQAILFDLIEHFRFELPDGNVEIVRLPAGIMGPLIKDKPHEGMAMPLKFPCGDQREREDLAAKRKFCTVSRLLAHLRIPEVRPLETTRPPGALLRSLALIEWKGPDPASVSIDRTASSTLEKMGTLLYVAAPLAFLLVLGVVFRNRRRLRHLRGPPSSFLWGNVRDFSHQQNVGELDFSWLEEYGTAFRIGGVLGEDILMLSDPKALQHVFHKSGYHYTKHAEPHTMARVIAGRGILVADGGPDHQRHRKIMNPSFTAQQLRTFLPLFRKASTKLCQIWKGDVVTDSKGTILYVNKWLARLTLDIIGETAFDFDFGALDEDDNEVSNAYNNMFVDSLMHPSGWNTLFKASWSYLPACVLDYVDYIPTREYKRFRQTMSVINKVSKRLIDEKTEALLNGGGSSKDVMSILGISFTLTYLHRSIIPDPVPLVRANVSENPKTRLSEEEMVAQMSTLTLAGHETTASTLTWYLYELARHSEFQTKLRDEVMAVRNRISARGETDLTIDDLDSMAYLQAGMKVPVCTVILLVLYAEVVLLTGNAEVPSHRLPSPAYCRAGRRPPALVPHLYQDGADGDQHPGQEGPDHLGVYLLTNVWGADAHEWNPMRFVNDTSEKQVKIGMYSNVMTFSAGLQGCIGWRFSVIEMQAILFDLIEHFRFELPDEKMEILRLPSGVMGPLIKDKPHEGIAMPLKVYPA